MSALNVEHVTKRFGDTHVLNGIDLDVEEGELIVCVGPSGCGKSTLLRIIAGLEDHTSGHVRIAGTVVDATPPARRGIAMVFQSYALYPHLSVADNMSLALKREGVAKPEIARRIAFAAEMLALNPLMRRRPAALSGGQRQRVAIGRAIVRQPKLFLFDEPLSNLDAALRVNTRLELASLHRKLGATMIYVTHDQTEAMTLADRIVVLDGGRVQQIGTPRELYEQPSNRFVAGFVGSPKMNLIEGEEARRDGASAIGIRPEDIRLVDRDARWSGEIRHMEYLGADTYLFVHSPEAGDVTVRASGHAAFAIGHRVGLAPVPAKVLRFDEHGRRKVQS
ncbi:ABC transporter ATP-binding protein [Pararobbsia silviterrae]|uniref:ABC transporter ATP-binding protein n=1 Tax=Pararobbsia silviterrae TaxID=1792498 RepID=A0A494XQ60_9BURK|nr:ABC transporter ATP-binding protein [Pararobbsia silviterrae]RKP51841.1 ABC transporter ATP-binding protein [Pararobbsia silviterrae]